MSFLPSLLTNTGSSRSGKFSRLLVVITVLYAVIVAGLSILAWRSMEGRLIEEDGQRLAIVANELASQLSSVLAERASDARVIAHTLAVLPGPPDVRVRYMEVLRQEFRPCCRIVLADAHGRIIASTDPAAVGTDAREAPWILGARRNQGFWVGELLPMEANRSGSVIFAMPIGHADDGAAGTLSLHIDFADLVGTFTGTIRSLEQQQMLRGKVDWLVMTDRGEILDDSLPLSEGRSNLRHAGLPSAVLPFTEGAGFIEGMHVRREVLVDGPSSFDPEFEGAPTPRIGSNAPRSHR